MKMAVFGVILNIGYALMLIFAASDPSGFALSYDHARAYGVFGYIGLFSCAVSIFGLVLVKLLNPPKVGAILVILGSVMFVPLGLVAIFGASRVMRSYEEQRDNEDFEKRQQAYLQKQNTEAE